MQQARAHVKTRRSKTLARRTQESVEDTRLVIEHLQIASAAEQQSAVAEEMNTNVATIRDVAESL